MNHRLRACVIVDLKRFTRTVACGGFLCRRLVAGAGHKKQAATICDLHVVVDFVIDPF